LLKRKKISGEPRRHENPTPRVEIKNNVSQKIRKEENKDGANPHGEKRLALKL